MEKVVVEATATEPAAQAATVIAPRPGTMIAPKPSAEAWVDPDPEASTKVVVHDAMIEDAAPLRSVPMPETISSNCGVSSWLMTISLTRPSCL
jgi:hypothetical protein